MQEIEQSAVQSRYSGATSESIQSTLASSQDINGQTKVSALGALARGGRLPNNAGPSSRCGQCCGRVWTRMTECLRAGPAARRRRYDSMRPLHVRAPGQMNSVSQIDTISRFLFPFTFVSLNVLYWAGFYYYF